MSIKTVNSDNLAEYVANRTQGLQTNAQIEEAVKPLEIAKDEPQVTAGEETVSTAPDPGSQEPSAKKGPKPVQPRLDELTREKKEALEFAEEEYERRLSAERRIKELEEQVKAVKPEKVEAEPELVEPDPKKYTDQDLFNKDWKEYQKKVIASEVSKTLAVERAAEQQRLSDALLTERVERARAKFSDFDTLVEAAAKSKRMVPPHVQTVIQESTYGPEIAHYLLANPAEEARIFKMAPIDAVLELGEIAKEYKPKAGKAEAEPEKKPEVTKPITRAPAPITALKDSGGAVTVDLSAPMPFSEYRRHRMAERRENRR